MARRKSSWTSYLPLTIAIFVGAAIYEIYTGRLTPGWQLIVPWSTTAICFLLWQYERRGGLGPNSKGPKIKRFK